MASLRLVLPVLLASALQLPAQLDQGLLAFVPSSAKAVVGLDVQRAKLSGIGQYVLNHQRNDSQQFEQFVAQTGFDPRRDLQYLLIATDGSANRSGLFLARGSFDVQRMEAAATAKGDQIQTVGGKDVIVVNKSEMVAFPEFGIAVAGDAATVRSVLTTPTPTALNPTLVSMIRSVSAQNDFWIASVAAPSSMPGLGTHDKQLASAQTLQSIQQVSGGLQFSEPVQVSMNAVTRSPQDAAALGDVIRFASNMLQARTQNNQPSAAVAALQQMVVATNGPDVHVALALPEQALEQFLNQR